VASQFDVVVAGASIAGCSAARLFALAGARVALVERKPDPNAYKVVCTHQIQSSAVPAIERLGLAPLLDEAGAVRSRPAGWSPYGGWMQFPEDTPRGYALSRRRLDPLLRDFAAGTPGVEYLPGQTVVGLLGGGGGRGDSGRVGGVETASPGGERRRLEARLTVAADGRESTLARLARNPARVRRHERFVYFAYWRGVETPPHEARVWWLEPDGAAVFPNEDGLTLVAAVPHKRRLAEFRPDPEAPYRKMVESLPEGPDLTRAERVSKLIGKLELPNKMRPAALPGIAFVGDAGLATDPLFGVGCGWAFQSAEWLVEEVSDPLLGRDEAGVDDALVRYRRAFLRRLGPHHLQIADFSTGRRLRPNERIIFRAAARDPVVAAAIEEVVSRRAPALRMIDPRPLPRVLWRGLRGGR
jgi:flavin-dependent dehydrogenase